MTDKAPRTLRILLVTEAASAGVGRHVVDLAAGLLAAGCRVDVIYSGHRMDYRFASELPSLPGIRYHRIDMNRGPHPGDCLVFKELQQYIRHYGPFDVVHCHSSKAGIVGRLVRARPGQSIVYTPHCVYSLNPDAGRIAAWLARLVERRLAVRADATIAVSPQEHHHLIEIGLPPDRIHTIPNGVDPMSTAGRADIRRELGLEHDEVAIGFVGRLTAQKHPELLIAAMAQIQNPSARLVVVGEGPQFDACRALADQVAVASRLIWAGYRTAAEMMPALDILALPSRYEAMPYVLLEGLAAGLPIVATDVGGVAETVTDGVNGRVVCRPSAARLASALSSIVDDASLRARYAAASIAKAREFSIRQMVDQTYALYLEVSGLTAGQVDVEQRPQAAWSP